jgi:hypothetical protein
MSEFTDEEIAAEMKRRNEAITLSQDRGAAEPRQAENARANATCLHFNTPIFSTSDNPLCVCLGD